MFIYPLSLTNVLSYTCDQASYSQDCEVRLSLKWAAWCCYRSLIWMRPIGSSIK